MQNWQVRWSPTLGELEDTHQNVWGTRNYENDTDPTVFFGLYGLPDFYTLWRHKGRKAILWAGSDIRHFIKGYWLEDGGEIKTDPRSLAAWINKHCENYVENEIEHLALKFHGIDSKIVPSFLGDVNKFEVTFDWKSTPQLYTSVSGDDFKVYGWDKLSQLAWDNLDIEFHCYGNITIPYPNPAPWPPNVIFHGRVPKEQMNTEIQNMSGALRLTEFDGFSEILAKSVLMGQWPVSLIRYPHMLSLDEIRKIKNTHLPNKEGKEYYLNAINKYPWNQKLNT